MQKQKKNNYNIFLYYNERYYKSNCFFYIGNNILLTRLIYSKCLLTNQKYSKFCEFITYILLFSYFYKLFKK